MISIRNASKSFVVGNKRHPVFDSIDIDLPTDRVVGILGAEGSGKSTLVNILSGFDSWDTGTMTTSARISWPVGDAALIAGNMTARDNVLFLARIYGNDLAEAVERARALAALDNFFDTPVRNCTDEMRRRLALALSYAFSFDCYLVDGKLSVRDRKHHHRFIEAYQEIKQRAGVLLFTRNTHLVKKECAAVVVIAERSLRYFEDVREGLDFYRGRASASRPKKHRGEEVLESSD